MRAAARRPSRRLLRQDAVDVADALLCVLVFRRATALTLAPNDREYEVALVRESSPETLLLPAPAPRPRGGGPPRPPRRARPVGAGRPPRPHRRAGGWGAERVPRRPARHALGLRGGAAAARRPARRPPAAPTSRAAPGASGPTTSSARRAAARWGSSTARAATAGPAGGRQAAQPLDRLRPRDVRALRARGARGRPRERPGGRRRHRLRLAARRPGLPRDGVVEGQTLEEALGEGGTLPPVEAVRVVLKIADRPRRRPRARGRAPRPQAVERLPHPRRAGEDRGLRRRARGRPPARGEDRGWVSSWARPPTWPPSRRWPCPPTTVPTSTRSAASSSASSPARRPSAAAALLEVLRKQIEEPRPGGDEPARPPAGRARRVRGESARQAARRPLPQRRRDAGRARARAGPARRLRRSGGAMSERMRTVLVVDADPATAQAAIAVLPGALYRVLGAADARQALATLGGQRVDVLVERARPAGRERPAPARRGAPAPPRRARIALTAVEEFSTPRSPRSTRPRSSASCASPWTRSPCAPRSTRPWPGPTRPTTCAARADAAERRRIALVGPRERPPRHLARASRAPTATSSRASGCSGAGGATPRHAGRAGPRRRDRGPRTSAP